LHEICHSIPDSEFHPQENQGHVTLVTSNPLFGRGDSYQGTPSGVPQRTHRKKCGFSRRRMAIPSRNAAPAHVVAGSRTFFVTSSIAEKRNLLQSDRAAALFVRVLYEYTAQGKFRLHEFVVMPDHFHVLITVGKELTIERAVQFIKGGFAFRAGKEFGFRAPVWQNGFSEVRIVEANAFERTAEYIRDNPVRRGLASSPEQFLYSSANPRFELDPMPQGLKPFAVLHHDGMAKAMP
jgi:putative transposase